MDDLLDRARSTGLDGVCLTEHDAFWPDEEVRRLSRRHGVLVLPGSEINTDDGHVIVFGLKRYVFGLHKPPFLVDSVPAMQRRDDSRPSLPPALFGRPPAVTRKCVSTCC